MAELKTKRTKASASSFIAGINDRQMRADCKAIARIMRSATGSPARMWGTSIVGFGEYEYRYRSGRSGKWMLCGFSPRSQNLTIYIMSGFSAFPALMKKLGKYKTGKSCLYVRKLDDIDRDVLTKIIDKSVDYLRKKYAPRQTGGK